MLTAGDSGGGGSGGNRSGIDDIGIDADQGQASAKIKSFPTFTELRDVI